MPIRVLEDLSYILVNLEGHTGFAPVTEIIEKVLNIHFWLTLKLCTSRK